MQRPTYSISPGSTTVPAVLNSRFHVCTSLAPIPMTVRTKVYFAICVCPVICCCFLHGLWASQIIPLTLTFENGVLCNRQQPGRAENSFIDQDKFVAMKTLSGCKAPRCDKHQFHDKITVRT